MTISKRAPIMDRLMARREVTSSGCWMYLGSTDGNGYGTIGYQARLWRVHRLAVTLLVGPIPDGHVGDHECHNRDLSCAGGPTCLHRRCFNPAHVTPVPRAINDRTGRHGAHEARKTHCPAGHAYSEYGVRYPSGKNRRECRECKRLRSAAFDAKRRAERKRID